MPGYWEWDELAWYSVYRMMDARTPAEVRRSQWYLEFQSKEFDRAMAVQEIHLLVRPALRPARGV